MNNSNRSFGRGNKLNRQPNMKRPNSVNQNNTAAQSTSPQKNQNRPQQSQQPPTPSQEQIDNLASIAGRHLGKSPEEMKKAAQSGNLQKLLSQMSPSQAKQLQKILSDENAAKKLLSTPQAQELLRRLSKNE